MFVQILKTIAQFIILCVCFSGELKADTNIFDYNFMAADSRRNLNYKVLKAVAKGESNYNPLLITFVISEPNTVSAWDAYIYQWKIPAKKWPYKRGYIYEIYPPTVEYAISILPAVKFVTARSSYDLGLMQINSQNITQYNWDEIRLLADIDYNIDAAAILINDCRRRFNGDVAQTIECYNKGFKRTNFTFDYFKKIQKNFSMIK